MISPESFGVVRFINEFCVNVIPNEFDKQHIVFTTMCMTAALFVKYPEFMYELTVDSALGEDRDDEAIEIFYNKLRAYARQV